MDKPPKDIKNVIKVAFFILDKCRLLSKFKPLVISKRLLRNIFEKGFKLR